MVKIALDAGHGINTAGKRTPDGEREWSFNNKVLLATVEKLNTYENVQILRLDDPTGKTDISLSARTSKANAWKADVLVSIHHNAYLSKWGSHGGVETFVHPTGRRSSYDLANVVNPMIVKAMGLRNRGVKQSNLHMVRESNMTSILTEGAFMDSTTDIGALRDDNKLKAQGYAIAEGLATYYKLKPKKGVTPPASKPTPPAVKKASAPKPASSKPAAKPSPPKSTAYFLTFGDTGARVGAMQRKLNQIGHRLIVDSSFGHATLTALKSFQRKYKIEVDGSFGVISQATLDKAVKEYKAPTAKPAPIASLIGKRVESKVDGLHFYSKPTWDRKFSVGSVNKGIGFPTIVGRVSVDGAYQYRVKNSKGRTFYITAADKYVTVK